MRRRGHKCRARLELISSFLALHEGTSIIEAARITNFFQVHYVRPLNSYESEGWYEMEPIPSQRIL